MTQSLYNSIARTGLLASAMLLLGGCGVSAATQAKIDEYNRTIPSCSGQNDCAAKWAVARTWVLQNADFPLLADNENVIETREPREQSQSGTSAKVERIAVGDGRYELRLSTGCHAAYGCPNQWDLGIDFNRRVAAAN